jgi:hypothetical protein
MVDVSTKRRIGAGVVGLALVATLGLTGCNEDNTPKAYDTLTQQNFLELCTNLYFNSSDDTLAATSNTVKADVTAPTQEECQCQYDVFVNQVPINDNDTSKPGYNGPNFTDLNAQLKSDPATAWATLPASVTDAVTACVKGNGSGADSSTSSTTTPASTTTAA